MAILSGSNNQFQFWFSQNTIPQEIEDKYIPIIQRISGLPIESALDYLNYSIQSISLSIDNTYDPITQSDNGTKFGRNLRPVNVPDNNYQKELTITFQLDSSYIIYFLLKDIYDYYFRTADQKYLPNAQYITLLDGYGNRLYRIKLNEVLFTGISGFEMNFSDNTIDQKQITGTFKFETMDLEFLLEE